VAGKAKPTARSQALRKGMDILSMFSNDQPEWGITEIARGLGIQKSLVHRMVKTWEDVRFLRQDPLTRKYSLGFGLYQMGILAARRIGFTTEIRAILKRLATQVEATVYIVVRDGDANRIIDSFESPGLVRIYSVPGTRIPWNRGASSKLLYAFAPAQDVEQMIQKFGLIRHARKTITSPGEFRKSLKQIRNRGYAVSDGEGFNGILGIAAPIFDPTGSLMAALQTTMHSAGLSETRRAEILSAVIATAAEITALLSGRPLENAG
jgi:DNA-binding IclR family transcriptional regulator